MVQGKHNLRRKSATCAGYEGRSSRKKKIRPRLGAGGRDVTKKERSGTLPRRRQREPASTRRFVPERPSEGLGREEVEGGKRGEENTRSATRRRERSSLLSGEEVVIAADHVRHKKGEPNVLKGGATKPPRSSVDGKRGKVFAYYLSNSGAEKGLPTGSISAAPPASQGPSARRL